MYFKKIAYKVGDLFEMLTFDRNQKLNFFESLKTSKNMKFFFCKLKNLKKHEFHFLQA